MSSLKFLRNKIASIHETKKITKSMELVAGTKLKKLEKILQYHDKTSEILLAVIKNIIYSSTSLEGKQNNIFFSVEHFLDIPQFQTLPPLLIAFTSEKSLCGNFNQVIMKNLMHDILSLEKLQKDYYLIIIGKKGHELLERQYISKITKSWFASKYNLAFLDRLISEYVFQMLCNNQISNVCLYFYEFKNSLVQNFTKKYLLDFFFDKFAKDVTISQNIIDGVVTYEGRYLFKNLLMHYLLSNIRYAVLNSFASEEAIRRVVMDNASNNATEIANELCLIMNKKRQSIITTELIEIISGLSALE